MPYCINIPTSIIIPVGVSQNFVIRNMLNMKLISSRQIGSQIQRVVHYWYSRTTSTSTTSIFSINHLLKGVKARVLLQYSIRQYLLRPYLSVIYIHMSIYLT